jgi:hypothetical protein
MPIRILTAAFLYFAIVFVVGFALGPIRVLALTPRLGAAVATLCEAPFLILAMVAAARWVPVKLKVSMSPASLAAVGIEALILQQAADFTVGLALRGIRAVDQLHYLVTPAGLVYLTMLVAFAAMPCLVRRRGQPISRP